MSRTAVLAAAAFLAALPFAGSAANLDLPQGAVLQAERIDPAGTYALPVAAWREGAGVEVQPLSGKVSRQAWRIAGTGLTSFQILLALRNQLVDAGYEIRFECATAACGGFDFRYGVEVIGEPEMHVDLGDYHFLAADKPGPAPDAVSLLVSRSASSGFVQVVQVGALSAPVPAVEPMASTKAEPGTALPRLVIDDIGPAMEEIGRFVLGDLVFNTGSAELGPGDFGSLRELAGYLKAHPEKRVALVGHTDAQGSLAGNISLSKRRAESVMARLVADYGVAPAQLEAEGIGYLAPIASNQTDAGRTQNRRVEAILVSTR